jgi:hypothetical protein
LDFDTKFTDNIDNDVMCMLVPVCPLLEVHFVLGWSANFWRGVCQKVGRGRVLTDLRRGPPPCGVWGGNALMTT